MSHFVFRLIDGAVPEELVQVFGLLNRARFPETMASDIVELVCEVDIDRLPVEEEQDEAQVSPYWKFLIA